ncbi:ATP-dependent DNA helicase yku80 [Dispira parvispora]|uniref:ATP-dependent DNA helicase yku80 n=1 Tax=Dispira parvispora TaxID=1520584 RepID=A0A9W8AXG2_9FUNG|nr:ATP-dependent DNA helicase yku80 [Dispira parvispora]
MNRVITVYVLDVGSTMAEPYAGTKDHDLTTLLPSAYHNTKRDIGKCLLATLMEHQIVHVRKRSYFSTLLVGTKLTDHHLVHEIPDSYFHISQLHPPETAQWEHIRTLMAYPSQETNLQGDIIDALIVAMDLIRIHCAQANWVKQICIVTDGQGYVSQPDNFQIIQALETMGIQVHTVGIGWDIQSVGKDNGVAAVLRRIKDQPDQVSMAELFYAITMVSKGSFQSLENAMRDSFAFAHAMRGPAATTFRGSLTFTKSLGDHPLEDQAFTGFSFDVRMYCKTIKANKYPRELVAMDQPTESISLHRSVGPRPLDNQAAPVTFDIIEPKSAEKSSATQPTITDGKEQPENAAQEQVRHMYRLGSTLVDPNCLQDGTLPHRCKPGLYIWRFIKQQEIPLAMVSGQSYYVTNACDSVLDITLFASFVHTLKQEGLAALVFYVRLFGNPPVYGALLPPEDGSPDHLVFVRLPYREQWRPVQFPFFDQGPTLIPQESRQGDTTPTKNGKEGQDQSSAELNQHVAEFIQATELPASATPFFSGQYNHILHLLADSALHAQYDLPVPVRSYLTSQFQLHRGDQPETQQIVDKIKEALK